MNLLGNAADAVAERGTIRVATRVEGEEAVVELMTHPGETSEDSVPYSASGNRLREIEALT